VTHEESEDSRLLSALCDVAEQRLGDFSPQDLAMTISGLSRVLSEGSRGFRPSPAFFEAFCETVMNRLDAFAPPDVAMTLAGPWGEYRIGSYISLCDGV
jgi:hypothetical protein